MKRSIILAGLMTLCVSSRADLALAATRDVTREAANRNTMF